MNIFANNTANKIDNIPYLYWAVTGDTDKVISLIDEKPEFIVSINEGTSSVDFTNASDIDINSVDMIMALYNADGSL